LSKNGPEPWTSAQNGRFVSAPKVPNVYHQTRPESTWVKCRTGLKTSARENQTVRLGYCRIVILLKLDSSFIAMAFLLWCVAFFAFMGRQAVPFP
jgi:hypothetical protein